MLVRLPWMFFIWKTYDNTDCDLDLSNVKRMNIWTVVRTVLEKNPGIKAKELIKKVRGKTGLSRSTIYEHLNSLVLRGMIYREKGKYWLEKPSDEKYKDATDIQLLKQLEERLGSELDLTPLRLRAENLNSLVRAGAKISSHEAELNKLEIENTIDLIKMNINGDDPHLSDKYNLLHAVKDHLRLVVDSLVKE
jgi:predicted transcriptional regulator